MARYTLSDFNTILKNIDNLELQEDTIKIINDLAGKVGAPEYIKTPLFKNKEMHINNRRKKNNNQLNGEWETIRTFKKTEIINKTTSENNIHLIRKYLNMITNNSYSKIKEDIVKELKIIISNNHNDNNDNNDNNLNHLYNEILQIIINNTLYTDIYAKLYKDLITEFPIFNHILLKKFNDFELLFKSIEYIDPEKDYNKFCENNKNNETRRSICIFYINLMKENILEYNKIGEIILTLFESLNTMISVKKEKNIIDEISELLYIMIINSYEYLSKINKNLSDIIYNNVIKITKMKTKDIPGITNKCIFKHMDILDEIS